MQRDVRIAEQQWWGNKTVHVWWRKHANSRVAKVHSH